MAITVFSGVFGCRNMRSMHIVLFYFILANMVVKIPIEDKVLTQVIMCKELMVSSHLYFDIGRSDEVFN